MDLSAPAGRSVNDGISRTDFSMQYIRFDDIVRMITKHGRGALIAKVDLQHAFRQCPVRRQDWPLLCYCWNSQYYFDLPLPFGLRSSPALFNRLAEAIECICRHRGALDVVHYLDDFVTCGPSWSTSCADNKQLILTVCQELGVKVSPEKVEGPSSCLIVLGIEIDTVCWQMRLPEDKCREYLVELDEWSNRVRCTRRQLDSILGCLFFASHMVRQGRTFLRRLVNACTHSPASGDFELPDEARSDLTWWRRFLKSWNGQALILEDDWLTSADLHLQTDAVGAHGYGAICGKEWFRGDWDPESKGWPIFTQELYPIFLACLLWSGNWAGRRISFLCDNGAVVQAIQSGWCWEPIAMSMLRTMLMLCALKDCCFDAVHVAGCQNVCADALSRAQMNRFRTHCPQALPDPVVIPAIWTRPWQASIEHWWQLPSPRHHS